jgi:alpha-beta hydrolase superfamily lysophospholipase
MMSTAQNEDTNQQGKTLVLLLHGYAHSPSDLRHVRKVIEDNLNDPVILVPHLPIGLCSLNDPNISVREQLAEIDKHWEQQKYERIILVGHSCGALLVRKLYLCACGENADAPLESSLSGQKRRDWAEKVDRIILLAGINRGWSISHHTSLLRAIVMKLGIIVGHLLQFITGRRLLIFTIRRGAPFITQLRIQWLSMQRHASEKKVGKALVIQLLGSIDDLVAPEDNIDLATGQNFVYVHTPYSGHETIVEMDDSKYGRMRAEKFTQALTLPAEHLEEINISPVDLMPQRPDEEVTDVVFVIHGIRDKGFWTHKIALCAKMLGNASASPNGKRKIATETSTYGYFAMLPFILPTRRRAKVEWFMDQYTEDLALFPNASFSFVGHSNGTYLVAKALKEYPACHFKHIVFAGSVVRTDYDWANLLRTQRVEAVLNYVATADWVVACFSNAFQKLGWQDLGSAGHDGFKKSQPDVERLYEIEYVKGQHSAALSEENWDAIAHFIVNGKLREEDYSTTQHPHLITRKPSLPVAILGKATPLILLPLLAVVIGIGYLLLTYIPNPYIKTVAFVLYLWAIWRVITRV